MKLRTIQILCVLVTMCWMNPNLVEAKHSDRVKLSLVQTLTLHSDRMTSGRRSSPIKQMTCVGGYCRKAGVTSAQCYNRGFDGRDVQWECKAEMPSNYKFGRVEVICEGYDYPEDDYILVGSCGMEYTIEETGDGARSSQSHYHTAQSYIKQSDFSWMPIIVIVAIIAFVYFTCLRDNTTNANAYSSTGDDYPRPNAPPPPGFRSDFFDSTTGGSDSCRGSRPSTSASSGPGFFSGMAAGGLMGYLFGSSRSNTYANRPYASSYSGWDYGPSTSGTSYSGGSSSSSSGTHTSSGYASTRRR